MKKTEFNQCLKLIHEKASSMKYELTEEDLRAYIIKTNLLNYLGYKKIGEDIRLEKTIHKKRKRPDIQCLDEYGNVILIIELKKPSDEMDLEEHIPQLWESYVIPLKAQYGVLTNGLRLLMFERIGLNHQIILDKELSDITETGSQLIMQTLNKPIYNMTSIEKVLSYFEQFTDSIERRPLNTELARELFYEDFMLKEGSLFSKFVYSTIELFDHEYGESQFLTSAYDFWLKSYAKKPEKIPDNWKKLLKGFELSTSRKDLDKFMFCLETTYALFTRLILAKACEDYEFPHINFYDFMQTIKKYSWRGDIPLVAWGILLTQWIENMRESLVESVFEEDIFYWWTDKFFDMRNWATNEIFSYKVDNELIPFGKRLADVMFTLYKYDFSKITGDPLGDLYQKYFDKETRKALGEFYTPKEVVEYILDSVNYKGEFLTNKRILDPACGSGTFLVESLKRYLNSSKKDSDENRWNEVLRKLCNEFHIVGFDIHPFATIMSQIHFMLILLPFYKMAIKEDRSFVLRRIPIFRTDSLLDEKKQDKVELMTFTEDVRNIQLTIPLPIKKEIKTQQFLEIDVIMPRSKEVWKKTDLKNIPEYFCALQALFDIVKHQARNKEYKLDRTLMEKRLKEYLYDKEWEGIVDFLEPYGNNILIRIKELTYKFGDGRLVKSIEDVMLAGLLKNYVKYDFVVGNPPYVRTRKFTKEENERFRNDYFTPYGSFDLYIPFMERSILWLKDDGMFSFITSNKYFIADYGKKLRPFILNNCQIIHLLDLSFCPDVFEEPLIYSAISVLKRNNDNIIEDTDITVPQENNIDIAISFKNDKKVLKEIAKEIGKNKFISEDFRIMKISQKRFANNSDNIFDVYAIGFDKIIKKICSNSNNLSEIYDVQGGYMGFEYHVAEQYVFDNLPEDVDEYAKILTPSLIEPYNILWGLKEINIFKDYFITPYLVFYDDMRESIRDIATKEKIVVRGISKGVSGAYDDGNYTLLVNVFSITETEKDGNLVLLEGILNSELSDFYHKVNYFLARIPEGSLRYPKPFWETFPLKKLNTRDKRIKDIEAKVKMLHLQTNAKNRIESFPDIYLEEMNGMELIEWEYTFIKHYTDASLDIVELLDNNWGLEVEGKEIISPIETKEKAIYLKSAMKGESYSKGEKVIIHIPINNKDVRKVLKKYKMDLEQLKEKPIETTRKELDKVVYDIYGLNKNDIKGIRKFLSIFY